MTTVGMVLGSLCDMAPVERKMEFDNVGLLAGDAGQEVSRVLLCLDITMQAVEEARQQRCQLIVSHHPLFFSLPKALRCDCYETARVTRLLQYGISAICMHTNLDCAAGGVNDVLLQRLGLSAQGGLGEQAVPRLQLFRHRAVRRGVHRQPDGLPCGGHSPQQVAAFPQKRLRTVESRVGVIAVQNVQQGLHPLRVRGLHTKINPLPGDGGGLRFLRRDVLFRTLVPQVLVVLVVHPGLGGVGKVPLLHIHIRIAHPNQIAPVHLHGGVEQAEAPGDQRDGQEDHATPLDGLAVQAAVDFVREHLGVEMQHSVPVCSYSARNSQCIGKRCPFSAAKQRALEAKTAPSF